MHDPKLRALLAALAVVLFTAISFWCAGRWRNEQWLKRTPLLVVELRGELDAFDVAAYRRAFQDAGVARVAFVRGAGLRAPVPPPEETTQGPAPLVVRIVVDGRRGPNPHVAAESRQAGKLGPGYTEGDTAIVYVDELQAYMKKHRQDWLPKDGSPSPRTSESDAGTSRPEATDPTRTPAGRVRPSGAPDSTSPAMDAPGVPSPSGASPSPQPPDPREASVDWSQIWRHLVTNTAIHESWHAITHSHSHNPTDVNAIMYVNAVDNVRQLGLEWPTFTRGHLARLQEIFAQRP